MLQADANDWLRINVDEQYPAIALYKSVAIGSGGLSIGNWSVVPAGTLNVTGGATIGGKLNAAGYGPQNAAVNAPAMEIGGPDPAPNGTSGILFLHDHGRVAHQLRYNNGTLYLEGASTATGYGTHPTPSFTAGGDVTARSWLRASGGVHAAGNGGVLNVEGVDHCYIQWYPQKVAAGRKGWIGYGGGGTTTMSVQSDAGPLQLGGAPNVIVTTDVQWAATASTPGRMHLTGPERCYILHKEGLIIGKEWGGNGSLSVQGTKNFHIDHPADPTRSLVHSVVEGPEAAVFYRGEAALVDGRCEVELPAYFEALTRKDARTVQLTPRFSGDGPITSLAAGDVVGGKFRVRAIDDRAPAQRFYWEVKAVRADVDPIEVEPLKSESAAPPSMDAHP
jgi:hypothetical protein